MQKILKNIYKLNFDNNFNNFKINFELFQRMNLLFF